MDGARKRKLGSVATDMPPQDGPGASKKIKLLNSHHAPPAAQSSVQELGQRLMSQLRVAKANSKGHFIAEMFLTLPPRHELPDYYDVIKMPIAFDTIDKKLQRDAYPTMTTLESDLKRLVQNAKEYNAPKSDIYEDAERIRKLVFNYMKQHNPAYQQDSNYSAFPTPFRHTNGGPVQKPSPQDDGEDEDDELHSDTPRPPTAKVSEARSDRKESLAPSAMTGNDEDEDGYTGGGDALDFNGMSFQEAQQKIVSYLLHYTDEEGLEIYSPFGNLPTRKLEDYYQVIRHPVSLKAVAKRCRGQHGRAPPSGVSDFKTWDAFEEEMGFIWRNAWEYNEEGSGMYNLANDFKEHFQTLLSEARQKVDEPSAAGGPRIKLGGPKPKVTLNLSQHRNSPAPPPSTSAAGVHVDPEALARQKLAVANGVNGQHVARPQSNGVVGRSTEGLRPQSNNGGFAGSPPVIKSESSFGRSYHAVPPGTNGMMPPPPSSSIRPPTSSGSPHPSSLLPSISSYTYTAPGALPPIPMRRYPLEQALLPVVTIATHPQLPVPTAFSIAIPPHPTLAQQSTTITLPDTHYSLQICPTISRELSTGRAYKIFVTLNGVRLNQRDTRFLADTGRRTHVYEGSLMQGVNRVEVEVVASREDGGVEGRGDLLDVEKVTVYAHLMR
ncbi:hypothetical protein LTR56_022739 [Elasticomyces elasticus]|nr:hypothetical protein LTR56_022739 [Elasticomyces elasticus]KAK4908059.1 hypothetical protein LTR49_023014 [Elasticomyces elasticus]KAK5739965.1 hypothetical protein LTS12_025103 [Elasticomyces elasticus]